MRVLLKATIPVQAGNAAIKDGRLGRTIESSLEQLHTEASYFTIENGKRCCYLTFDMKESWEMPVLLERMFLELEAELVLTPVMNLDELRRGLQQLGSGR